MGPESPPGFPLELNYATVVTSWQVFSRPGQFEGWISSPGDQFTRHFPQLW